MKAGEVANFILTKSEKGLSNLELQKTLYFVELDYYKQYKRRLIDEDFEAWRFGPVLRDVYVEYCHNGANTIRPPEGVELEISDEEKETIKKTIEKCNKKGYWQLVEESHRDGGAWSKSYKESKKNIIPRDLIETEAEK